MLEMWKDYQNNIQITMALKNTYSRQSAGYYIEKTEASLVKGGASGIGKFYEGGKVIGLQFTLNIMNKDINFKMPVGWKKVQQVLENEGERRAGDDEYAYRVSWAIMKDWVEAQMAIIASENVTMPQLFLSTLFDAVMKSNLLLGDGK